MGSAGARGLVAVLAIGAAVALFIVLSGDDEESAPATTAVTDTDETDRGEGGAGKPKKPEKPKEPPVPTIEVKGGEPVGGVQELEFESGGRILFRIASDAPAEFHLHGYDVIKQAPASGEVVYDLPAEIEGVFELENHDTAAQLAEISVVP